MLNDVAKQILALAAGSKRGAPQNVFQQPFDLGPRSEAKQDQAANCVEWP